jgi:hypothetical protein
MVPYISFNHIRAQQSTEPQIESDWTKIPFINFLSKTILLVKKFTMQRFKTWSFMSTEHRLNQLYHYVSSLFCMFKWIYHPRTSAVSKKCTCTLFAILSVPNRERRNKAQKAINFTRLSKNSFKDCEGRQKDKTNTNCPFKNVIDLAVFISYLNTNCF